MTSVATPTLQASALADLLVAADLRGHFTHGLNRLEMYVNDMVKKVCAGDATPVIIKESVSTALVDGKNGLGPVVGNFCMDLAIQKAKQTGVGWVCAKGSNHYGIAGWYAMTASKQGLMVESSLNSDCAIRTNPIALAAPGEKGDDFVLDMATSVVSGGKVEVACVKGEDVPAGWALDRDGAPTTNAERALDGYLLPLGGDETHSGYKGFGLGMMVEIFCGILTGAPYGSNIRDWTRTDRPADLSQCFVAVDPSFFAPGFEGRMTDLMNHCRNMEPEAPQKPVLVAGDPERLHMRKVEQEGGITYHINQINNLWKLAKYLDVTPLQP
ncbi:hypothetical protein C7M84_000228 [Penaeus vannamei]|uniref:Malate dehydrogenase n=1 Tax=Penaeus vannamei TaxID=6689 RepID=A0A3R7QJR4_PENVA|nr:hypothetical protein C7M84_000228 [Penaeus vannamei]